MKNDEKILQVLSDLQTDILAIKQGQEALQTTVKGLEQGQKSLVQGQKGLEQRQKSLEQGQAALRADMSTVKQDLITIKTEQRKHGRKINKQQKTFELILKYHDENVIYLRERIERLEEKESTHN